MANRTEQQVDEFVDLVRQMRLMQREYFKSRRAYHLEESKRLEKMVDAAVKSWGKPEQLGLGIGGA